MYNCINLDWLEIFCYESPDLPITAEHFARQGWNVKRRAYGTRQYEEMFTLCWGEVGVYEIRRNPLSKKSSGGIFADTACHIRLCNRQNYVPHPIHQLVNFLKYNGIHFKSISRFDLCMDFAEFDKLGKSPAEFVKLYMQGHYAKIHQSRLSAFGLEKNAPENVPTWDISAHGDDNWEERTWNSLKWGSPTSLISTKLYNKTMELNRAGHDKPYIRDIWKQAGLPEDRDIWRIEFSIHAGKRHQIVKSSGQYQEIKLEQLSTPELIQLQFFSFYSEYFHFKVRETTRNGTPKRKDLCKSVVFFVKQDKPAFEPTTVTAKQDVGRTDRMLIKRLREIASTARLDEMVVKTSCGHVMEYIKYKMHNHGISQEELDNLWAQVEDMKSQIPLHLSYDR